MTNADSRSGGNTPKSIEFHTSIRQTGKNTTGIQVPEEVVEELGSGQRPLVRVTVNGYTYRSSIAKMQGEFMISLGAAHRDAAGVHGGDEVEVILERDLEPRTVEIPDDLKAALTWAGALDAFERSAPSMQKEIVRQVETAKAQETRERRIAKIVEKLGLS